MRFEANRPLGRLLGRDITERTEKYLDRSSDILKAAKYIPTPSACSRPECKPKRNTRKSGYTLGTPMKGRNTNRLSPVACAQSRHPRPKKQSTGLFLSRCGGNGLFSSGKQAKKEHPQVGTRLTGVLFGALPGTRTLGPLIKSQLLYQLS